MHLKNAKCNLEQQWPNFQHFDICPLTMRRFNAKTLESGGRFYAHLQRGRGRKTGETQQKELSFPKLHPDPFHADPELARFVYDVLGDP